MTFDSPGQCVNGEYGLQLLGRISPEKSAIETNYTLNSVFVSSYFFDYFFFQCEVVAPKYF